VARFAKRRRGGQTAGLYFDSYFDDGRLARLANAIRRGFGAGAVACPCSSPAAAQVSQQASYADPSFQTILNNPGNLASQVKYAAGAKDDPDIENAISAYDRLLFYNPALARVRFELGVLYARLGSY
jgi:hypothetical protein